MPLDLGLVVGRARALEHGGEAELCDLVEVIPPFREALAELEGLLTG